MALTSSRTMDATRMRARSLGRPGRVVGSSMADTDTSGSSMARSSWDTNNQIYSARQTRIQLTRRVRHQQGILRKPSQHHNDMGI